MFQIALTMFWFEVTQTINEFILDSTKMFHENTS